jgi:hypothetical protein
MAESERERVALDWYERRRDELFSTVAQARSRGDDGQVVELATALARFLTRCRYWDERETILRWGLDAARHSGQRAAMAQMADALGTVQCQRAGFEQPGSVQETPGRKP